MWYFSHILVLSIMITMLNAANLICGDGNNIQYSATNNMFYCNTYAVTGLTSSNDIINIPGVPQNAIANNTIVQFFNPEPSPTLIIMETLVPYVPTNMFHYFPNLVNISLIKVQLKSLNTDAFKNCLNLKRIEITRNRFTTISAAFAQGCTNLLDLVLTQNKITKVESGAFKNLAKLVTVNLQDNRIACIPGNIFRDTPAIENIDLSYNMITTLDANLFKGLPKLKKIDFRYNQLSFIPKLDLSNCGPSLVFIFDRNPIDALSRTFFESMNNRIPAASQTGAYVNTVFSFLNTGCVAGLDVFLRFPQVIPPPQFYYKFYSGMEECFSFWISSMAKPTVSC